MRAHVLLKYGKTNRHIAFGEWPATPLGPGQVRVRVTAAAINPVDLKTRDGEPKMMLPFSPPFVLGVDLAGTIEEVGADVTSLRPGDRVYGYTGMDRMGAFAESVVLDAHRLARAPAAMTSQQVACLPLPGLCAHQAIHAGDVRPGARVLVHGGVGGVGGIAVQLARARGAAEIHATVGGADFERARALGVTYPIDYRTQRFEDLARDMDFVFDTVGGDTLKRSWSAVKRGGTVATLHAPPAADAIVAAGLQANLLLRLALPLVTRGPRKAAARAAARFAPILSVPSADALGELAGIADTAGLAVTIDRTFPFAELAAAFDHIASGKARGRVVLDAT